MGRLVLSWVCVFALVALSVSGCGEETAAAGGAGGSGDTGGIYASKDLWLCRPDIEDDHCAAADLSTTEIHADGTRVERAGPAMDRDAPFDCFVVYSTDNDIEEPGNVETI